MRTEKKRMKMRSDKVTDGSPDSEHNDASAEIQITAEQQIEQQRL